jgi:hypothetical protein
MYQGSKRPDSSSKLLLGVRRYALNGTYWEMIRIHTRTSGSGKDEGIFFHWEVDMVVVSFKPS